MIQLLDITLKTRYVLGAGTPDERFLEAPVGTQGSSFDEWFTMLSGLQRAVESGDPEAQKFLPLIPIVRALGVLWSYTASDNERLRAEMTKMKSEITELRDMLVGATVAFEQLADDVDAVAAVVDSKENP